jgi:hypothetical protein
LLLIIDSVINTFIVLALNRLGTDELFPTPSPPLGYEVFFVKHMGILALQVGGRICSEGLDL